MGIVLVTAPAAERTGGPGLAALGDSFTAANYSGGSCPPAASCPVNSWATGTNPRVDSHYRRRLARDPELRGQAFAYAVSAKKVAALESQAASAVSQRATLVTILIGLNDLCRETEAGMTPVATFRAQFQAALDRLRSGLPDARVLVAGVPDPYLLWQRFRNDPAARGRWTGQQICQAMLGAPLDTSPAAVARRERVRRRGLDFTTQLREVCAGWGRCRFDGGAVATRWRWTVTPTDYFHPSIEGQRELSELLWRQWRGVAAPRSL